jgi:hypothetical protein
MQKLIVGNPVVYLLAAINRACGKMRANLYNGEKFGGTDA